MGIHCLHARTIQVFELGMWLGVDGELGLSRAMAIFGDVWMPIKMKIGAYYCGQTDPY